MLNNKSVTFLSEYNQYSIILHLHTAQCQRWWQFLVFTKTHFVDAVYSSRKWFIYGIFFYHLIYPLFYLIWKPVRRTVGKGTCICFSIQLWVACAILSIFIGALWWNMSRVWLNYILLLLIQADKVISPQFPCFLKLWIISINKIWNENVLQLISMISQISYYCLLLKA